MTTERITGGRFRDPRTGRWVECASLAELRRRVDQVLRETGHGDTVGGASRGRIAYLRGVLLEKAGVPRVPRSAGGEIDVHPGQRPVSVARVVASKGLCVDPSAIAAMVGR